ALYRRVLEVRRASQGESHPSWAAALIDLASVRAAAGHEAEALDLMQQAAAVTDRLIGQVFSIASGRQRLAYLRNVRAGLDLFLSLVAGRLADSPAAVRAAFEMVLRRKALEAEGQAAQRDAVLTGRHPELAERFRAWSLLRGQIAEKTLAGPGPEGAE